MNDHAVDAMLYAWLAMKEKGGYKMIDYINFGNVVNVSTSVPVAIDDSTYHIIIDFVPDDTMIFDNFHDDMAKILEHPDDYVLCNIEDIVKARDEIQELKGRIKELEGQLAEKKIADLERKLDTAKANERYWCNRKEEEEEYHHHWLNTYNLAVANAANEGVRIFITGEDKENNVGVVQVKNEKAEELEVKIGELKKELDDLKSKKIAKCTLDPSDGKLTFIYTYMDGHSESTCIIDDVDPNGIPRDRTPKCSSCKNHRYFTNGGHYCHLPDSKYTIPGMFHINSLTEEDAEGPACDKFEARKE